MKNWRTTLIGWAGAAAYAIAAKLQEGSVSTRQLVLAAIIAVGFTLAKDAGVTGTEK